VDALAQLHPQNPHWFNRDRFVLSAGHGSALLYSQRQLSGIILEEQTGLTLTDVCSACAVHAEYIIELVDEGVLVPVGREPVYWRFSGAHMRRAMVVLRLQRDLGINLAGVALALQLLDEIEALRANQRNESRMKIAHTPNRR
jgi:chaperone modulatory protein CbpM